jgi:hypothetical protein
LKWINKIVVALAIMSTCLVMYVAFGYYSDFAQKWIRTALLSIVLAGYTTSYLVLSAKRGAHWFKTALFAVTYVVLGLSVEFVLHGYSKGWAPASSDDAQYATFAWLLVICSIIGIGIYAFARKQKNAPNK